LQTWFDLRQLFQSGNQRMHNCRLKVDCLSTRATDMTAAATAMAATAAASEGCMGWNCSFDGKSSKGTSNIKINKHAQQCRQFVRPSRLTH